MPAYSVKLGESSTLILPLLDPLPSKTHLRFFFLSCSEYQTAPIPFFNSFDLRAAFIPLAALPNVARRTDQKFSAFCWISVSIVGDASS